MRATALERDHRLACTQFGRAKPSRTMVVGTSASSTRVAPEFVDPLAILIEDLIAIGLVNQSLDHPQHLSTVLVDPPRLDKPAMIRSPCSLAGRPSELLAGRSKRSKASRRSTRSRSPCFNTPVHALP